MFRLLGWLQRWLRGEYMCVRCGRTWYAPHFGTGKIVCPECYRGEQPWRWEEKPWEKLLSSI